MAHHVTELRKFYLTGPVRVVLQGKIIMMIQIAMMMGAYKL